MVDGLGIGDVGEVVLRDRKMLAKDGIFVVIAVVDRQTGKVKGSPDIISRGFVYLRESKELLRDVRKRVIKIVETATGSGKSGKLGICQKRNQRENWTIFILKNTKEANGFTSSDRSVRTFDVGGSRLEVNY